MSIEWCVFVELVYDLEAVVFIFEYADYFPNLFECTLLFHMILFQYCKNEAFVYVHIMYDWIYAIFNHTTIAIPTIIEKYTFKFM